MIKKLSTQTSVSSDVAKKIRVAIVRTDYHKEMLMSLEKACRETLIQNAVPEKNIQTYIVPGSWELPVVARKVAALKKADVIICFGVILKGQTFHFEMIANECARAMMQIAVEYGTPVINEVLAVYDMKDAAARTGDDEHNKGIEAATAALKVFQTLESIQ